MVASPRVERLKTQLPTLGGALSGLLTATALLSIPVSALESLVWESGVAALVPAVEPPLGVPERLGLAIGGGLIAGVVLWSVLYLLFGPGGPIAARARPGDPDVPMVRRADAHPDAPPRRPLIATADLGTPLMEVHAAPPERPQERPLPRDLDLPLAAFDPAAVPETPMAPTPPLPSLAPPPSPRPQIIDPGDRIETFELTPVVRTTPPKPAHSPSIEALLRRLEQGASRHDRRSGAPSLSSLDETLGSLRRLAS